MELITSNSSVQLHEFLIGTAEGDKTADYTAITISGTASTGTTGTWNANVTLNSGTTSENYIKGENGAVNLTGEGSLIIDIIDSEEATNGLSISGDASGSTVKIGNITVTRGTLAIADGTESATVSAGNITVGAAPATDPDAPATAAAPEYTGILTLSSTTNAKNATLGDAESIITVNSTGKIEVTAGSGTATINGKTLTLNDKAMFLSKNDGTNAASTSTLAVDNLTELAGAFHIVSGSASHTLTQNFTGKTASFGGNLLITEHATLDLKTKLATGTGDIEGQGTVTLEKGSNTVLGGTLKVSSGTLTVANGAQLNASVEKATIAVADTGSDKSTLEISSATLKQFLDGGAGYKDIKTDGTTVDATDSKKGAVTISSGTLRFTDDSVTLSDFGFKGTNDVTSAANVDAGKITFASGSVTNIVGKNFTIKKQLDSSTTGANSKIMLKADSLSLGGDAAVADYGFSGATVANLYNTNTAGAISLGNAVTLDVTVGSDPSTTIPADANGVFSGDFVLDDSTNGKLTVAHGTYTHKGSLTISGGSLTVQNETLTGTTPQIDTKLTLDKLDLHASGSTITVDGKNNSGADTILDISNVAGTDFNVVGHASTSGTITVKDQGTLVATADQVKAILDVKENKGFAFEINKGTLAVEGDLELDATNELAADASTFSDKKLTFHKTNGGTLLVNGELALDNITAAIDLGTATNVSVDELTLNMADAQIANAAVLSGGNFTAWSGLSSNSTKGVNVSGATLTLGGFDGVEGSLVAKSNGGNIKTDLTLKDGNVTIQNGSWKGANQTITVDAGNFKVGDATKHGASGSTFDTSLTVNKLALNGGKTLIDTVGSVTVNDLTASGAALEINGSMTVNGLAVAAGAKDPNYGVHLAAGSIDVGENAELTFKANAVKAITVNTSNVSGSGWISAVDGTFGKANPTDVQTVINAAVGSTVTFEFDSGTSFGSEALAEFRKEIFGVAAGGNLAGFVNLGDAQIAGLTDVIENNEIAYDDLKGYIDVNSDFTIEALQNVKVTGIDSSSELRGSLGSLSSTELGAGEQIAVDGNLALNNAAANGGKFAANAAGEVLGLDVTENVQVNLNNGGEVGTVSFSNKGGSFVVASENGTTTIGAIDGAKAKTQFITGTATVKGTTETAQLTTAAGTNTTFEGVVTVGKQGTATDVSTLAGNTTFKEAANFAQGVAQSLRSTTS